MISERYRTQDLLLYPWLRPGSRSNVRAGGKHTLKNAAEANFAKFLGTHLGEGSVPEEGE